MQLRSCRPADQAVLADLWFESWRSTGLQQPVVTRNDLARRARHELATRWTVTVAEAEGRLIGFVAICLAERRLDQLFVAPEAQGQGVGRNLFDVARSTMPDGFWLSTQTDNLRARAFYERQGMSVDQTGRALADDTVVYVLRPPERA
ncbi:GNAT family N-acetyltransferase [Phenylobacterium kunshanense]|uniref:GNAT family N-acetyltransferase n=1 Tax=Phenylobacterium kunshanense TaxID=1445034 RepID=A0A328BU37_9CAUL|nr:GNAT family N-acetyltransferase [Phenylobacterium kunshanense]RAK68558.1 GNAT family N-acetyltransferase [Phenylobacterium kunshanense]